MRNYHRTREELDRKHQQNDGHDGFIAVGNDMNPKGFRIFIESNNCPVVYTLRKWNNRYKGYSLFTHVLGIGPVPAI